MMLPRYCPVMHQNHNDDDGDDADGEDGDDVDDNVCLEQMCAADGQCQAIHKLETKTIASLTYPDDTCNDLYEPQK